MPEKGLGIEAYQRSGVWSHKLTANFCSSLWLLVLVKTGGSLGLALHLLPARVAPNTSPAQAEQVCAS